MIIVLKEGVSEVAAHEIAVANEAFCVRHLDRWVLVSSSKRKEAAVGHEGSYDVLHVFGDDMQLASRKYMPQTRVVDMFGTPIGGSTGNTLVIAGPCSVESMEQIDVSARLLKELGIKLLRGGCYKPRTSPYTFQGLGLEGLELLELMRARYGLGVITEVRDATHVDEVIAHTDIIQVGAKAMYDQGILRRCAQTQKPVLLKRGFGSTLQELVQAAEFVLSGGNPNVVLCERGIRTFETKTRFTLDLCGVAYLKEHCNLPVILDPSHAMGYRYGVPDLTRACVAMGVDGLLIEVHPNPKVAQSDAEQQLNHADFRLLYESLERVAGAVGRRIV